MSAKEELLEQLLRAARELPETSPVFDGDLRVVPSTEELRCIARLLDHEGLAGQAMLTQRGGSPWIEVSVYVPHTVIAFDADALEVVATPGTHRYAIWRYTCAPYRIGSDGAVEDDPIWTRDG